MIATLTFNLPEDQEEFRAATQGQKSQALIEVMWDRVFRPAFKHGYSGLHSIELNRLLQDPESEAARVVQMLSEIYQDLRDSFLD